MSPLVLQSAQDLASAAEGSAATLAHGTGAVPRKGSPPERGVPQSRKAGADRRSAAADADPQERNRSAERAPLPLRPDRLLGGCKHALPRAVAPVAKRSSRQHEARCYRVLSVGQASDGVVGPIAFRSRSGSARRGRKPVARARAVMRTLQPTPRVAQGRSRKAAVWSGCQEPRNGRASFGAKSLITRAPQTPAQSRRRSSGPMEAHEHFFVEE